jgi:predicted PhzF superfamily epimerase YddE/YHI9
MEPVTSPAVLIEAFSSGAGTGNGAAVVRLRVPLASATLQTLAATLRQSETAFVLWWQGAWFLRWFSPSCEVDLCGHATLASALALAHWGEVDHDGGVVFQTRSGRLESRLDSCRPSGASILLPGSGLTRGVIRPELQALLHRRCGESAVDYWTSALGYHVALLPRGSNLAGLTDLAPHLHGPESQGLVVMAAVDHSAAEGPCLNGARADYQLRFFAPALGIPEDPVTGSAHALVASYWFEQTGRDEVVGWQPSTSPGGMRCRRSCSGMIQLLGTGHLLWDGTLHFEPGDTDPGSWEGLLTPG